MHVIETETKTGIVRDREEDTAIAALVIEIAEMVALPVTVEIETGIGIGATTEHGEMKELIGPCPRLM